MTLAATLALIALLLWELGAHPEHRMSIGVLLFIAVVVLILALLR